MPKSSAIRWRCFIWLTERSNDAHGSNSEDYLHSRVPQRIVGARRTYPVDDTEAVLAMFFFPMIGAAAGAVMLGTLAVCWPLALLNAPPKERKTVRPKVRKGVVTEPPKPRKPVLKVVK